MSIAIKILKYKSLTGFILAMLITLTTASIIFAFFYGFTQGITEAIGGVEQNVYIVQAGSKSIHFSWVPISIAKSLNRIPGVRTQVETLTPVTLYGKPIIFRGTETLSNYEGKIVRGSLQNMSGPWLLLGQKAFEMYSFNIGDILVVGSPKKPYIVTLYLAGVYSLGNLKDYEAVVPLEIGDILADLPTEFASLIQVEGMKRETVETLTRGVHNLTIEYEAGNGELVILDSISTVVATINMQNSSAKTLQLPFGYYAIIYREPYITSKLGEALLTENKTISLTSWRAKIFKLEVLTPSTEQPTLQLQNGTIIKGQWNNERWIFEASFGLHTLYLNQSSYLIPLISNTTFSPPPIQKVIDNTTITSQPIQINYSQIEIRVQLQDGTDVNDYLISVRNINNEVLDSRRNLASNVTLTLPEGEYEVEVSKPPYLVNVHLKVPEKKRSTIILPTISNPSKIPIDLFQRLTAVGSLDASMTVLSSLVGLTIDFLLTLTTSLAVLSIIAIFTIHRAFYNSSKENFRLLILLGAGKREIIRMIGAQILLINLALSISSFYIATFIWEMLSRLRFTILGYGLPTNPIYTLIYSIILSILPCFISITRLHSWIGRD